MVLVHGVHRPSRARSAHDLVAHGIGQNIMQGHFPIGSTLPGDAELMELFGVSRTSLREALKTLASFDERKSKVVELRFFGGLTVEETADVLGVSVETVMRDWKFARGWLLRELRRER